MEFDSYFDRIRVKPNRDRSVRQSSPACEWPGCQEPGAHRAPKGREKEREYWRFCLDHVREYNHSYNYFAGMSLDDVAKFQKEAIIGHRPTWKMGQGGSGVSGTRSSSARFRQQQSGVDDPLGLFRHFAGAAQQQSRGPEVERQRTVHNAERKALDALGLEVSASKVDIKARFKLLVKRHHPDANGGDRSTEDRLREVIQAYNYLKSVRFR
jgi:hypothetical protein